MKYTLLFSLALPLLLLHPASAQVSPTTLPTGAEASMAQRDRELAEASQMEFKRAEADVNGAKRNYEVALKTLEESQRELRRATHRLDVSSEALQKAAAHLDEQLEVLELEEAGSAARRKATEEAIKQETDRVEKRVNSDPVAAELQNVVKAREGQLARLNQLVKTAVAPQSELEAALASVAEAKAKLAERQQSAVSGIDGESLASLRRDLLNLSISEEERHAKMQYLKMQQQRLSDAMNNLTGLQERKYDVDRARAILERAQDVLEQERIRTGQSLQPQPGK